MSQADFLSGLERYAGRWCDAGNSPQFFGGGGPLVALGLFFLYSNFRPGLDPWPLLSRYWPLLLIFLGLGKVWDQFRPRDDSPARRAWLSGGEIAVILLLVIAGIALSFQKASRRIHDVQAIDRQGSEAVRVHIKMPAGELKLSGGANKLMEADFNYDEAEASQKPPTAYRPAPGNSMSPSRGKNSTSAPVTMTGTFVWPTTFPWNSRWIWVPAKVI